MCCSHAVCSAGTAQFLRERPGAAQQSLVPGQARLCPLPQPCPGEPAAGTHPWSLQGSEKAKPAVGAATSVSILLPHALFHRGKLRHKACEWAFKSGQPIKANTHSQVHPDSKALGARLAAEMRISTPGGSGAHVRLRVPQAETGRALKSPGDFRGGCCLPCRGRMLAGCPLYPATWCPHGVWRPHGGSRGGSQRGWGRKLVSALRLCVCARVCVHACMRVHLYVPLRQSLIISPQEV